MTTATTVRPEETQTSPQAEELTELPLTDEQAQQVTGGNRPTESFALNWAKI